MFMNKKEYKDLEKKELERLKDKWIEVWKEYKLKNGSFWTFIGIDDEFFPKVVADWEPYLLIAEDNDKNSLFRYFEEDFILEK